MYAEDSEAAVALYLKAFDAELGYHVRYEEGGYLHAEIVKDGQTIIAGDRRSPLQWAMPCVFITTTVSSARFTLGQADMVAPTAE